MITRFEWTQKRTAAAIALAKGHARERVARDVGATRKTLYNWLCVPEFSAEVDRLTLMVDVAAKAARMRIASRVIRSKVKAGIPETSKDLLDWLKFAQSETQGVKLGLTDCLKNKGESR
jgi:hypothetical protein